MESVNKKLGITIVIITHQIEVVKDICDRVAVMENGSVVEEGRTADVFSHPKMPVTKSFIETAGNIGKIYELIKEDSPLTSLKPGEKMYMLTYTSVNTKDAIISYVSRTYNVNASIIFGNVEVLKDIPLGKLVVVFSGDKKDIDAAVQYIESVGIDTEEIK